MKERQRWQPEEDALLRAYVKQYGPKEWNLVSQRMGRPLDRDAKSCLERWKNYLKPGIKKGSLTLEEQNLVISLQAKYGNKWKKIASQVPGRTAKRLGKWWEVFKEKQLKLKNIQNRHPDHIPPPPPPTTTTVTTTAAAAAAAAAAATEEALQGKYDHILETFAEKYVQPNVRLQPPILSLGCSMITDASSSASSSLLPPWMMSSTSTSSLSPSSSATPSPSVSLSLSPSDPPSSTLSVHQMGMLIQYCKELEEGRQNWLHHKKEATWRLSRLEQQLESEKARKRREMMEEMEAKIRCLREEEMGYVDRIESECREQINAIQRDAEAKEAKMVEMWVSKHVKLGKLVVQMGNRQHFNVTKELQ